MSRLKGLTLGLLASFMVSHVAASEIQVSTGDQWLPFTDDRSDNGGIATSVVRAILENMGEKPAIKHMPWRRAYELARKKHFTGTFPWYDSADRRVHMAYSEPFLHVQNVVFVRADAPQSNLSGWDEASSGTLCRPTGYTILPQIEEKLNSDLMAMVRPPTLEHCMRMLVNGRADYVMSSELVGWRTVRVSGISSSRLATLKTPVERSALHFLVPKDMPGAEDFLARFNASYHRLRDDKVIDKIIARERQSANVIE